MTMAKKKEIEIESIEMQVAHLQQKWGKKHLKHIAPIEDEINQLKIRLTKLRNGNHK
jgi:hypothetical protein